MYLQRPEPKPTRVTAEEGASGVVVRHYQSATHFAVDAGSMASAGWRVVAQAPEKGGMSGAGTVWALVAALFVLIGFLNPLLWIGAILFAMLALSSRTPGIVVTYEDTKKPASGG